jgi:hypothetical protein
MSELRGNVFAVKSCKARAARAGFRIREDATARNSKATVKYLVDKSPGNVPESDSFSGDGLGFFEFRMSFGRWNFAKQEGAFSVSSFVSY